MICFKSQTKKKSDSSLKMIPMPSKQLAQTPTRPPIKLAPKEIVIQVSSLIDLDGGFLLLIVYNNKLTTNFNDN